MVNGCDIKELNIDSVRNNIAIVPQKPMLFSGSIAENIRWGNKEATNEMLHQAADKAQAGFIDEDARWL